MFAIIKFFAALALLQFSHALVVVSTDSGWTDKAGSIISAAVLIDAAVVLALLM